MAATGSPVSSIDRFARNLDWNLLKYFTQIARSKGIGAAAASLHLSQPSVSAALRKLEGHLGAQLFVRTRKGVQLTAVGELLVRDCEQIVARIEAMPIMARELIGTVGGSVLLKTISHVASSALDAGLRNFRQQYPQVDLVLETAPWEHISKALISGELAIGVGFDDVQHATLRRAPLTFEYIQLYCAASHPLAKRAIEDPGELADQPFVAFSEGEPAALRSFRERHGLGQHVVGFVNTIHDASWLISLGVGIGMLPEPAAQASGHDIVPLLPRSLLPCLAIDLLWRSDLQDRAGQLLIDAIVRHINDNGAE